MLSLKNGKELIRIGICMHIADNYIALRESDVEIIDLPILIADEGIHLKLHRCKEYIHEISEGPVKQLIASCLVHSQERRPSITMVYEIITDIVTSNILI